MDTTESGTDVAANDMGKAGEGEREGEGGEREEEGGGGRRGRKMKRSRDGGKEAVDPDENIVRCPCGCNEV